MKYILRTTILISVLTILNCAKPVTILVPDSLKLVSPLPVVGTENSWKLDIGNFHVFNIKDINSRVLLNDAMNATNDIKSFEFIINNPNSTQFQCYCEFPMKSLDDETFRCIYQNLSSQSDYATLTDKLISSPVGEISIEDHFEYEEMKEGSKNMLVGYRFVFSDAIIGLVDVSNVNKETVWIDTNLDIRKQILIAASSISLLLKHRKWYDELYNSFDEDVDSSEPNLQSREINSSGGM